MTVLPVSAPTQVPMASTRNGCWIFGKSPFSSSMPAFALTPRIVPSVEKKSPQNAVKIKMTDEKLNTDLKSRLNMTLPSPVKSGTLAKVDGTVVTPAGIPRSVAITIPIRIAPFTLYAVRIAMITSPRTASITAGSVKFPMPIPLSVKAAIPVFLNPR